MIYQTYSQLKQAINSGQITSFALCSAFIERIEQVNAKISAFLAIDKESILQNAHQSDQRRADGQPLSEYDGIPIGIKDNICIQGQKTSCASQILTNFVAPYHATVIDKLLARGFILFPGLNMDEFAMGSSTENSSIQTTKNPFATDRIPGGSSGGSAAAIAASMLPLALGSDTGGSIRQPASLCGVYGLKPTYGRVSRYGLVAYASSLDQIGPFARDPQGIADVLAAISGHDSKDATSAKKENFDSTSLDILHLNGLKIGIMQDEGHEWQPDVKDRFHEVIDLLTKEGAQTISLDFSLFDYAIPIYYIIATAECSSNLSRFDGIRYGKRAQQVTRLEEVYQKSRSQGFGKEVKRRILLGTFSLSSGYYDAYYGKAQKARILLKRAYEDFFKQVDIILQPTSPTTAFKIGEKAGDPIQMYKADILTTSVNLAGLPALSLPAGVDKNGLPIGIQATAPEFCEDRLIAFAKQLSLFDNLKIQFPENII